MYCIVVCVCAHVCVFPWVLMSTEKQIPNGQTCYIAVLGLLLNFGSIVSISEPPVGVPGRLLPSVVLAV